MFRRRRSPGIGIFLLAAQLMQTGVQYIPPVTLAVIALNTSIYLRVFTGLPSVSQACISYVYVWYGKDWQRIFLSPFFHLDDMHLYYNMVSFLWKGMSLETRLGSSGMVYLLSVFFVLTSVALLILDYSLSVLLNDLSYIHTCAAGFSGVIFALKVVTTYNLPPGSTTNVLFFRVPTSIAYWVELVVIQLLVPSVSFTGHLAGIIVGLLYVKGPLKYLMDGSVGNLVRTNPVRPSYTYNSGVSVRLNSWARNAKCLVQSDLKHLANGRSSRSVEQEEDAELQAVLQESLNDIRRHRPDTSTRNTSSTTLNNDENHITNEEIRKRRLRRFQN